MGCNVSADFDGCNEAEWGTLQKKSLTLGSQLNFQKKGSRKKIAKINAAFRRERGTFKLRKFWRSVNLSERLDLRRHTRDFARDGVAVKDAVGNPALQFRHRLAKGRLGHRLVAAGKRHVEFLDKGADPADPIAIHSGPPGCLANSLLG
jgi:hypothetical protein